jgi:hypothetical protein
MRFAKIRLVGSSTVDLPVEGVSTAGPFVLKSADGLGPPEVDVSIASTTKGGGVYQGRRPQNRQIVIRVGLQPDWDIGQRPEELRTILYSLLTPQYDGKHIKAQILDDGGLVIAEALCEVSRFETAIFTKDPEVQITLDCMGPYLEAPAILYETPALTANGSNTTFDITNIGTAPAEFWVSFQFSAPTSGNFVLSQTHPSGRSMTVAATFVSGAKLTIDTRAGSRGVWRTAAGSGVVTNILSDLTSSSPWLQLHGGLNTLQVNIPSTNIVWDQGGFGYKPAYWGV